MTNANLNLPILMGTVGWVITIVLLVLIVGLIVLILVGRHMQKKQEAAMPDIRQGAQTTSMLIIDKKKMKLKDAGFPPIVLESTPKYARRTKVPVVKAKVGPRVLSLMCDAKIFDDIPIKKEVKALVNGIYIIEVKGLRGPIKKEDIPDKKKKKK